MAYINQDQKKEKATAFKAAFPKVKATFKINHHSTLVVTIKDDALFEVAVNHAVESHAEWSRSIGREPTHTREHFLANGVHESNHHMSKMPSELEKVIELLNRGNFDKSDPMSDYFHVGFYLSVIFLPLTQQAIAA